MTPRMWSTSRWPRSASTGSRMASSSRPKLSAAAGDSGLLGCAIIVPLPGHCRACLQPALPIGARGRHAQSDILIRLARHHTCHAVLDGAAQLSAAARVTDPHPAAEGWMLAGALELGEQRPGASRDDPDAGTTQGHGDGAGGASVAGGRGDEGLAG